MEVEFLAEKRSHTSSVYLEEQPGRALTLYYDPKDPRQAVLHRGVRLVHLWPAVLGLLIGGVAVLKRAL